MQYGPIEMVVLQGTSYCNLNCSYCYLSEASRRRTNRMSIETIRETFRNLFASDMIGSRLRVSWHSGEPFVLKPAYYREAIETIRDELARSKHINTIVDFDFQTNGTLINSDWISFFQDYAGSVTLGISCDGPASLHDRHRKNWSGKSSHAATEAGMQALCDSGIEFDITSVVSPDGLDHPEAFISYFEPFTTHIREFHFNLHDELFIDPDDEAQILDYAQRYKLFLTRLLNAISEGQHRLPKLRNFSSFFNRLLVDANDRPQYDARSMSAPFKTVSIEIDGDLTTFYAGLTLDECGDLQNLYGDELGFVIGNILEQSLEAIAQSPKLRQVAADFEKSHAACERSCEYFEVCSGGYNLIKYRRHGRFDSTETPECRIHVKTFADTVLEHMETATALHEMA
mmetsp:Transcript_31475/g.40405  ORF Transcript_31475/g.40405 Transcript_31475/m.40405 type:complete len:400 (-) Transcript_31475:284-1483(-)|eukprot:CAMPEP_0184452932 /NCGR_PEP_ID=MMETSP0740-20130409/14787_1 /TAXON_ID=385413 /ORGANISM="Thalassiosira miniscula, Strain CCMP1093" /LENGTH=399 /DNA_ID=CAMNT_0026824007 /DNA_START=309 /DNA_END=1508 /DNA_ORIENTATION=-